MASISAARRLRFTTSSSTKLVLLTASLPRTRSSHHCQNAFSNLLHRRAFHASSTTLAQKARRTSRRHPTSTAAHTRPAPSRTRREQQVKKLGSKELARIDMGALELPIRPIDFWSKSLGYLGSKLGRRYVWNIIVSRLQSILQPFVMRKELFRSIWPSRKQDRAIIGPWAIFPQYTNPRVRSILATAKSRYRLMNTLTASGLEDGLEDICQVGLENTLSERIRSQPGGVTMEWSLVDSFGYPTVDTAALKAKLLHIRCSASSLSETMGSVGIQEAVIYLRGAEMLTYKNSEGTPTHVKERKISDYMVMQRRIVDKKVEAWFIHGMKEPTTFEKWSADLEKAQETDKKKARWWSGMTSYL